jgi:hypothetical protein
LASRASHRTISITSITEPAHANFITWWPVYRIGPTVFIQNHLLFLEQLPTNFDVSDPYVHVPERHQFSEEGECVSEWEIPALALERFLESSS